MLPLIILISAKYHKVIYWRLQVTEFTKFINTVEDVAIGMNFKQTCMVDMYS